jgi:thioredoxin-like negative regulator of GroEL
MIVPPEVAAAQKRANENPNDLDVQLDLALTYWKANWQKETYETIGIIIKLAGIDNRDFFMQAGDKFKSQNDGWLPAAAMYFQAVRAYSLSSTGVPNPVQETFREAIYISANKREAALLVPFERVAEIDQPIALIAQARNAYFAGRKDQARDLLNRVFKLEDTSREAALLDGEFAALDNRPADARKILTELVEDIHSTPEWIRLFAQQILNGIK